MNTTEPVTIAIVEDEPDLRDAIASYLERHGFAVNAYGSTGEFRADPRAKSARIAVLDINMTGEDGLSLARSLRMRSDIGIIFATALGSSESRSIGMEIGADDYLVKPFELRELLARVKGLLRRLPGVLDQQDEGTIVVLGTTTVNLNERSVLRDGNKSALTEPEAAVLKFLADRKGRTISTTTLASAMGKPDASSGAMRTFVSRLRSKIENDPSNPIHLRTVDGEGYVFEV